MQMLFSANQNLLPGINYHRYDNSDPETTVPTPYIKTIASSHINYVNNEVITNFKTLVTTQ